VIVHGNNAYISKIFIVIVLGNNTLISQ